MHIRYIKVPLSTPTALTEDPAVWANIGDKINEAVKRSLSDGESIMGVDIEVCVKVLE